MLECVQTDVECDFDSTFLSLILLSVFLSSQLLLLIWAHFFCGVTGSERFPEGFILGLMVSWCSYVKAVTV